MTSENLFYSDSKKLNLFNLEGEIFNIPFDFKLKNNILPQGIKKVNIKANRLKINIQNETVKKSNDLVEGFNITSILNSKILTRYKNTKNMITLESDTSRIKNSSIDYKGQLLFNPFDLDFNINIDEYDLVKLFNTKSILVNFLKTKLLFNENISAKISVNIGSNKNDEIFKSSLVNFNFSNGKLDLNNTKFFNEKIGFLEIENSNFILENDKFILNTDIVINIKNSDNLFSFFQTPKKARKSIKKMFFNIDFNILSGELDVNNLKIDNTKSNAKMLNIIDEFGHNNNYNLNKTRRIFNKIFSAYSG